MKLFRILAIVPLALISLMNVGYPLGTDPKPDPGSTGLIAEGR
jgi:hypothetical protein